METSIDLSKQAFKNEIVVDNDTHKIDGGIFTFKSETIDY